MAISEGGVGATAGFEGVSHQHVSPGIGLAEELGRGGGDYSWGARSAQAQDLGGEERRNGGGWLLNRSIHQKTGSASRFKSYPAQMIKPGLVFKTLTEYGDIFDCVDINKQPALDHPLLKNHKVQQAYTRQSPGTYYGAQGGISLHKEPATDHQSHRSAITVSGGSPDKLNAIQVGWTADNFGKTGCRDLLCPGFVQVDKSLAPGMVFQQLSTIDGAQHDYYFSIFQNNSTDENWWLMGWPEKKIIGYWPKTLFPDIKESFTSLEWGGYVQVKDPNTKEYPQMGSGVFPEEGYGKAAYFKFIKLVKNSAGEFQDVSPKEVVTFNDRPTCYRVGQRAELLYWPGYHFFYGGPGGNCGH
ncbi:hypothetical protein PVL29_021376 [Vitis rotundifolia]|uniref:Neprosin PEP catalytic domain-containing protein n=1 Tax=Vitis rotundifolia TaxID=103349 RepID=A0AA38YZJ0_VITRO|nr:hypothetical protein PVL29_021376 [Vitis rotundifolia]